LGVPARCTIARGDCPKYLVRFSNPAQFNDVFDRNFGGRDMRKPEYYKFRLGLGIFCLTEDPDNQLMWVHYAARHTGFVIGFKTSDRIFSEHDAVLHKVRYGEPCDFDLLPLTSELCLHKEAVWAYEKEWRCIRRCGKNVPREVDVPERSMNTIILGADILQGTRSRSCDRSRFSTVS
jgi:hypothetical protein